MKSIESRLKRLEQGQKQAGIELFFMDEPEEKERYETHVAACRNQKCKHLLFHDDFGDE